MKAKATIRLKFSSAKQLETVKASLQPEVNKPSSERAHVALKCEGAVLVLSVEAVDTVALRSTLNAYLRWISSAMDVVGSLDQMS
jgi:tRNA threonylcarbamoyladenosine modification (KEOPS) complex  Pcc1 subunit